MQTVRDIVRRSRAQRGWTQRQLAEAAGVGFSTIVTAERNPKSVWATPLSLRTLGKIEMALGLPSGCLLDLRDASSHSNGTDAKAPDSDSTVHASLPNNPPTSFSPPVASPSPDGEATSLRANGELALGHGSPESHSGQPISSLGSHRIRNSASTGDTPCDRSDARHGSKNHAELSPSVVRRSSADPE